MNLELTNDCNLRCAYCYGRKQGRAVGYMPIELARRALNEGAALGYSSVQLSFNGESTIHPRFGEAVAAARGAGLRVKLITNGLCRDEQVVAALMECMSVRISIHSSAPGKWPGLALARELYERRTAARSSLPRLVASCVYVGQSDEFVRQLAQDWTPVVDAVRMKCAYNDQLQLVAVPPVRSAIARFLRCQKVATGLAVLWNGDVTICCNDLQGQLVVGSIAEVPLASLVNGPSRAKRLEEALVAGHPDHPLCQGCESWRFKVKCAPLRRAETGAATAPT